MREIKFRGWDKEKKIMFPVFELRWESNREFLGGGDTIYAEEFYCPPLQWSKEIIEYTGLKDKNKREIWEGDIVNVYIGTNDIQGYKNVIIEMAFGQWGYFKPSYVLTGENSWKGSYKERECSKIENNIGYVWHPLIKFTYKYIPLSKNPNINIACELDIEIIGNKYENPEFLTTGNK